MADQTRKICSKESTRSILKHSYLSAVLWFYRLLSDFCLRIILVLKPLVYLIGHWLGTPSCWDNLSISSCRLIFGGRKAKKSNLCSICSSSRILFCCEIVGVRFSSALAWFVVPGPGMPFQAGLAWSSLFLAMESKEFTPFFTLLSSSPLGVGFITIRAAQRVQNLGITVLWPTVIIVFGLVIIYAELATRVYAKCGRKW